MDALRVPAADLHAAAHGLMRACGVDPEQADTVADNLVWNDLAGRANHGVDRLPAMMERVRRKLIRCPCKPAFTSLANSVELLDADDGFGQHAGRLAIDRAVTLARAGGIGVVGVRNSNFFGTGAYFVQRAAAVQMIGVALSNSFPKVAAAGGHRPVLGTNPLAFGAPRRDGRSLLIDMSTAALAGSTVREHQRRGIPLPEGFVVDRDGAPVTDAALAAQGTLLPASGAKGFGLALIVEILSGLITGAGISGEVASMYHDFGRSGRNGHFFLALDIARWMPIETYHDRIEALAAMVGSSGDDDAVRLPGAARWACLEDRRINGIVIEPATRAALERLARDCGVGLPW